MTNCNQEILKALFRTKDLLSEDALLQIRQFVDQAKYENGGFQDRAGKPDIYYSVFGYTLAFAYDIKLDLEKEFRFLEGWNQKQNADLIHAVCYIRCYYLLLVLEQKQKFNLKVDVSDFDGFIAKLVMKRMIKKLRKNCQSYFDLIEEYKAKDGGYNHNKKQADQATVYASFLVWTLFQDLNEEAVLNTITNQLEELKCKDASFANDNASQSGVSSATAAGIIMTGNRERNRSSIQYLKQNYTPRGGFKAASGLPIADVLSTSTALLALYLAGENLQELSEKSLDFINLHWDESGGFFGSIADMTCDVEYTYYALLGIGILI
ncbi:terpene cyclase/mutase family protein [Ancylomarina sp. DW003]|nr:prenyltransferase/squalene oxidase repeat-containing protein [Ancylomarina sp. DW003]MDE5423257.1 terpene cyclase/mutase family protein [Ancylomarina sp. DW003]